MPWGIGVAVAWAVGAGVRGRGEGAAMSRLLTYLLGPETVLVLVNLAVFWFCARHGSGAGEDLRWMERGVWLMPPLAVGAAFLTLAVPGASGWWWLGRAILASLVGTAVLAWRLVEGFGSGAKGQDAAYIIALCLTGLSIGLGTAVAGAILLARQNPAFAEWWRMRPVVGIVLTLGASVPLGAGLVLVTAVGGGLLLGLMSAFRR